MSSAALDRLLAVLVVAVLATGLLTLRAGHPSSTAVYVIHAVAAWSLAAALALKLARSVPRALAARRWGRLAVAAGVAVFAFVALAGGVLWIAAGRIVTVSAWTVLSLHAYAGIALLPLLLVHLGRRRWRLLWPGRWLAARLGLPVGTERAAQRIPSAGSARSVAVGARLQRRSLLAGGALALAGLAGWSAGSLLDAIRGSERRFTGSRWLPAGGIPPPTTFFGEPTPAVDPAAWRLVVRGRVGRPATYDLPALEVLGSARWGAVLDCTSGWAVDTEWAGVPFTAVLDAAAPEPGATRVEVRSVTGWVSALSLDEARSTLLATHVAGEPLPLGNGAPCRLVVPDRRGLDWVKWVAEIEVA